MSEPSLELVEARLRPQQFLMRAFYLALDLTPGHAAAPAFR